MEHMDYTKAERAARLRKRILHGVIYFFLGLWGLVVLFPFYWMVLTSVKDYASYANERIPQFFTLTPTLENYLEAFTAVPLARYFLNTLIFTVATTALMLLVIVPAIFPKGEYHYSVPTTAK